MTFKILSIQIFEFLIFAILININLKGCLAKNMQDVGVTTKANDCFVAPQECPNQNITFYLYTRYTQDAPQKLDVSDVESILNAKFVDGEAIKFLVHGYTGHKDFSPNMEIRPEYFKNHELNVISVDYEPLVRSPCYIEAVDNVPLVANCSAQMIDVILDLRPDISLQQFHIIALSLGAQVSGLIYKFLKHGYIERITGLDPALPLFYSIKPSATMLSKYSAKFVDVIHTNAGMKGKLSTAGHVDFYANSGTFQPGCGYNSSCSHHRAGVYYAESINSEIGFWSVPCSSLYQFYFGECAEPSNETLILMGEYVPFSARGIYFFKTNSEEPFAQGIVPYEKPQKWYSFSKKKEKNKKIN